jgi:hypothetical protein
VSYVLSSVPKSLPHRLSAKLSQQLAAIDYTHQNALRISSEIRRALKGPANDVRIGLQRNVENLQNKKEQTSKFKTEAASTLAIWFAAAMICGRQYSVWTWRLHHRELSQRPHSKAPVFAFGFRSPLHGTKGLHRRLQGV